MEDTLTAKQAIALFREILEDPSFTENMFYNLVIKGILTPLEGEGRKRYMRAEVVRIATQRKELASLVSTVDMIARAKERAITIKEKDIDRMVESGSLIIMKRLGRHRYFTPENVDKVLDILANLNELRRLAEADGLMESADAVRWINERLAEQGSNERLKLDTFYHYWSDERRAILKPDYQLPCGEKNRAWRFYFSENTLKNAPILKESVTV